VKDGWEKGSCCERRRGAVHCQPRLIAAGRKENHCNTGIRHRKIRRKANLAKTLNFMLEDPTKSWRNQIRTMEGAIAGVKVKKSVTEGGDLDL
jgi:hypothetical protein